MSDKGPRLLNIGSDGRPIAGWLNLDVVPGVNVDYVHDIRDPLPWTSCVERINASHVIEHLNIFDARKALKNIFDALSPGGRARVTVPDCSALIQNFLSGQMDKFGAQQPKAYSEVRSPMLKLGLIVMGNLDVNCTEKNYLAHKLMLDLGSLTELMTEAGFTDLEASGHNDLLDAEAGKGYSISIEARKP